MYYWYAYRMDLQAFGMRADSIAPLCPGSAPDGSCYFDEFVDYLQRAGKKLDAGQATSVGKYFWPDAVVIATELGKLKSNGVDFIPNQDPDKIFKSGTFSTPTPRLADIMSLVTDKIQAARVQLGDTELEEGLFEARTAMQGTHEARLADNGQDYVDTLNDYLKNTAGSSTTVETKNVMAIYGSTYLDVDIDATKAKDASFEQNYKSFLTWLGTKVKRQGKTKLAGVKMHWDAQQGVQKLEARVNGANSC